MGAKQVLFAYSGYEQGTWGDIAFRKERYYHYLPGIAYLAAAVNGDPGLAGGYRAATRHYNTSVQSAPEILADILAERPDCVGLSCYCWNLEWHLRLARMVKAALPGVRIMLGGPEIALRDRRECDRFFERHPWVDLLVFGEAELKIGRLVAALAEGDYARLAATDGYALNPALGAYAEPAIARAPDLRLVPSVYPHEIRVKRSPECGIHVVYECSRGCPNRCIYCEFVRRRNRQESFELERVRRELDWLLEQRVDGIHFADAVFDRDPAFAKAVLRHVRERQRGTTLLLYCSFHAPDAELVELLDETQCQVGIGVQSTSAAVLRTLRRAPSRRLFEQAPALLRGRDVNFYTDLMFGLPDDTMDSFAASFDATLRLRPKFFMLFPLSLIRGTALGDDPGRYGVVPYDAAAVARLDLQCEIEYRNLGLSRGFTLADLERFDSAALTSFYYYNRFPLALRHLCDRAAGSLFDLFEGLGRATKDYIHQSGRRPTNTEHDEGFHEVVRQIFCDALDGVGAGPRERAAFLELFRLDLLRFVILRSPQREKIFEQAARLGAADPSAAPRGDWDRVVKASLGKVVALEHPFAELQRLHELRESIAPARSRVFVHAPFERADARILDIGTAEEFVLASLPANQGVRYRTLSASYAQQCGRRDGPPPEDLPAVLARLIAERAVRVIAT